MTAILDPEDYGLFALFMTLAAFGPGMARNAASYLTASYLPTAEDDQSRAAFISTIMISTMAIGTAWAILIVVLWPLLPYVIGTTIPYSDEIMWLTAANAVLTVPWTVAQTFVIVSGRAPVFAWVASVEILTVAAVSLISLYVFTIGVLSLFVGVLSGSVVSTVLTVIYLGPNLRPVFQSKWLRTLSGLSVSSMISASSELLYRMTERTVLTRHVGLGWLGLYSHSEQYLQILGQGLKAAHRSAWPVSLSEAREQSSNFELTGMYVAAVQLSTGIAGIFFATLSRDLIALLTHDKFTDAYVLATLWMVVLLVRYSARPAFTVLYVHNKGFTSNIANAMANIAAVGLLFLLIPPFGVYGALGAVAARDVVYRSMVIWIAKQERSVPFMDFPALKAALVIAGALWLVEAVQLSLVERFGVFLSLSGVLVVLCINRVLQIVSFGRRNFVRWAHGEAR